MKTKLIATLIGALFIATLAVPWTVLAGGRGGGGGGGGGGTGGMGGGGSIGNRTQMGNRDMGQHRMWDGEGDRDRDRDRDRARDRVGDQANKKSGTGPAATTTESAMSATGEKQKKGNIYGPGDGTGPYLPKDGTGYGAPENR